MLLACWAFAAVVGCGPTARDVTSDARYAKYTPAAEYRLVVPARLVVETSDRYGTGTRYYLTAAKSAAAGENPRRDDRVIATLSPGTRLRVVKVLAVQVRPRPTRAWDVVRPLAVVENGPYAGVLVDLTEISHHKLARQLNADIATPASSRLRIERPELAAPPQTRHSAG